MRKLTKIFNRGKMKLTLSFSAHIFIIPYYSKYIKMFPRKYLLKGPLDNKSRQMISKWLSRRVEPQELV